MAYNVELKLISCMHACIEEFEVVFMANCYMHAHVYIQVHEFPHVFVRFGSLEHDLEAWEIV